MGKAQAYIPPRSEGDDASLEECALFVEAVARVSDAFLVLRETINPPDGGHFDLAAYDAWRERYGFRRLPHPLRDWVYSWGLDLLAWWKSHPEDRERLIVDAGLWAWLINPKRAVLGDERGMIDVPRWNPAKESFDAYASKIRDAMERFLQQEQARGLEKMAEYGAKFITERETGYDPGFRYEWVYLHYCQGLSDGRIALKYKGKGIGGADIRKNTITRARVRLAARLGFEVVT